MADDRTLSNCMQNRASSITVQISGFPQVTQETYPLELERACAPVLTADVLGAPWGRYHHAPVHSAAKKANLTGARFVHGELVVPPAGGALASRAASRGAPQNRLGVSR